MCSRRQQGGEEGQMISNHRPLPAGIVSKSANVALHTLRLLISMALVGSNGVALAQEQHFLAMPGVACQPDNQTYSYSKNIQGLYNNSKSTQIWICPITKAESDNKVGGQSHVRVIQNNLTQKIGCRFTAATSSGGFLDGQTIHAISQGVTTIPLNYSFDLVPSGSGVVEAYAI